MKKTISIFLSALMLCTALVSCATGVTPADTSGNGDSNDTSENTQKEDDIVIVPEGTEKSEYFIIYPASSKLSSDCSDLKGEIYGICGVSIWPKKDTDVEAGAYEILVGNTNRAESSELLSTLVDGEYAIKMINGKIVINAHDEAGVIYAVKEFIKLFVTESNPTLSVPRDLDIKGQAPSEFEQLGAGWTFKNYNASNNVNLPYQIYMPDNLDPAKDYPVLLFMHGLGSVGTNGEHITQEVAQFARNVIASDYKNDVIIIAPQHPKGDGNWWVNVSYTSGTYNFDNTPMSKYLAAAKELLDTCMTELPIDENRVYGYGNSMGAFATIYMAMSYPDLYAAIVPVAGGCDPTKASLIKDVPIWLFHGDADTTVNWIGSKTLAENLTALGSTSVQFTVYPGVNHATKGCFVAAANTPGLIEWMFSQSKADR